MHSRTFNRYFVERPRESAFLIYGKYLVKRHLPKVEKENLGIVPINRDVSELIFLKIRAAILVRMQTRAEDG